MRALIVEDDQTSVRLLQDMLGSSVRCVAVKDGQEGFDQFIKGLEDGEPFQIVFLDIMLPGVDGQEALAAIREAEEAGGVPAEERAKIIMTTSCDDPQNLYEATTSGCSDYLVKPVSRDAVGRILAKLGVKSE